MPTLIKSLVVLPSAHLELSGDECPAITLADAPKIFPVVKELFRQYSDSIEIAGELCDFLRAHSDLHRSHDHLFLLLYFNRVIERLRSGSELDDFLLPLSNARFCMDGEQHSVNIDFAFCTGASLMAVFIDESRFTQSWPTEQRLLKRWSFDIYRLMADEFETRGLMGDTGLKILDALRLR